MFFSVRYQTIQQINGLKDNKDKVKHRNNQLGPEVICFSYIFLYMYGWNFTDTIAEGVHQGGSLTIRTTPTRLRSISNTATYSTDLGRIYLLVRSHDYIYIYIFIYSYRCP